MKVVIGEDHFPKFLHPVLEKSYMVWLFTSIGHTITLFVICAQFLKRPYLSTLGILVLISSKIECQTVVLGLPLGIFL